MGPITQVAVGSMVDEATGSDGKVEGELVVTQVQEAGSAPVPANVGSLTLNGLKATSPVFSTTKR